MNNHSIWEKDQHDQNQTSKKKKLDLKTDILIIGGGITGITTAYFLRNSDQKVMLIDKGLIGMGVTCKTTAKLNYLQGIIYQELEKNFDQRTSKLYFDAQREAIDLITKIIAKEKIECDLQQCDSFIFTKEKKGISKINKEKEILEGWNIKCGTVHQLPIHFPIEYGIVTKDTYTFHPLQYIQALKTIIQEKLAIYEQVIALEITKEKDFFRITTNQGVISSKYVIVACHYPFFLWPGLIPVKTYIKREYVNASKFQKDCSPFTAISIDSTLHSIRFYKDYILYGSNQHRLTNQIDYQKNYRKSKNDFKRLFSKEPEYTWMNQDVMPNDKLPIVGVIDENNPNLLVATAFGAWGMTNGTIAAKVLADIILEHPNQYISLFQPKRKNIASVVQSITGILHYSKVYLQTTVKKNPVFYNDHVYVVKINGIYYGVYYDYYGKKHIVHHKCPHMKCNLVFNDEEKTWDCPCHGSRFDIDGKVLEGPANYSISVHFQDEQ